MSAILSCQLLQYAIIVIEWTRLDRVIYQLSNFQMSLEKLLVVLQLAYLSGISALFETSTMVITRNKTCTIYRPCSRWKWLCVHFFWQSVAPNEVIISVSIQQTSCNWYSVWYPHFVSWISPLVLSETSPKSSNWFAGGCFSSKYQS